MAVVVAMGEGAMPTDTAPARGELPVELPLELCGIAWPCRDVPRCRAMVAPQVASRAGALDAAVVGRSVVASTSFTPTGTPASGPSASPGGT